MTQLEKITFGTTHPGQPCGPCGPEPVDGVGVQQGASSVTTEVGFETAYQPPPGQTFPEPPKPKPGQFFDNAPTTQEYIIAAKPTPGQTYDEPAKPNPNDFFENGIGDAFGYIV